MCATFSGVCGEGPCKRLEGLVTPRVRGLERPATVPTKPSYATNGGIRIVSALHWGTPIPRTGAEFLMPALPPLPLYIAERWDSTNTTVTGNAGGASISS